ncbi:phage tail protein, partial [Stenotrophomonas muris]
MAEFLHGVQVVNIDGGSRSIAVASTSVIGIVGTAPRADKNAFPYNTPVLVTSRSQAAKLLANAATEVDEGTLPGQLDAIFD